MITPETTTIIPKEMQSDDERKLFYICKAEGHLRTVLRCFLLLVKKQEGIIPRILDVGCRNEDARPFFSALGYGWMGLDTEPTCNSIIKGDMHDIPAGDQSLEGVFCSHALEHSESPLQALREMKRIVKLGGLLFIATPAYCDYQLFNCDKDHVNVPTQKQMKRWCDHLGLNVVTCGYFKLEGEEDRFANLITICTVVNR